MRLGFFVISAASIVPDLLSALSRCGSWLVDADYLWPSAKLFYEEAFGIEREHHMDVAFWIALLYEMQRLPDAFSLD
jgi:hypothetical protein